jgi:hypothetical protein
MAANGSGGMKPEPGLVAVLCVCSGDRDRYYVGLKLV